MFLFLVDAWEHIACPNPADAGVFVVFISGWKFSACVSSFVVSVERHLHCAATGHRPDPDHEICQRKSDVVLCFQGRRTLVALGSFSTRAGTSTALIPPTLVDSGTGGRRLRVSDTIRLKFRYIRLGRMSVCVRKCRRIRSQLRKSDALPVYVQADETRPSVVSEETPTSELLPCLVIQLSVNTGCRSRYVLSPHEDGLLFQSSTTG